MTNKRAKAPVAVTAAAARILLFVIQEQNKIIIQLMEENKLITQSQKKYLFAIYSLGQDGRSVKSTEVSKLLGVSKASTVKMTQKLIDEGYIKKEPYREIELTPKGIQAANELYTSSVILRDFLERKVKISSRNAENDSVSIISQISGEAVEKLVGFILGF